VARSRLIVGLVLIIAAALLLIFGRGTASSVAVVAIAVLGVVLIAISRRK
jgi:hypothetical protein